MAAVEIWQCEQREATTRRSLRVVPSSPMSSGSSLTLSERRRKRALRRHRRFLGCVIAGAVVSLAILLVPGTSFGGVTNTGLPTDLETSAILAPGTVYIVQPGDTTWSIARLMNPLNPRDAHRVLVRALESSVVVPGEHVIVP